MSAEVIKEGTKSFWKTKSTIEILLVEHKDCDILEVVSFDPITSQEAPRVYVPRSKLLSFISEEEIQYRLFELQEPIRQRRGVIDNDALSKIAWNDALYDFIDERLELHKKLAGSKAFRVNLRKPLPNEDPQLADLMCCAPAVLVPFELDHFTKPRSTVLDEAKECTGNHSTAHRIPATVPSILTVPKTLTARQRWRIPIIFDKVFNGKRLKMADRIVWKVVVLKLLSEADPHERMAIANFESPTQCVDFAARRKVTILLHKTDMEPERAQGLVRPAPITITAPDAHGHGPHTKPSPKLTATPHSTPAARFTDVAPMHTGSFKFGISALSSSLQRGLNSLSNSLDTKNKQYRAAAGADLAAESPTSSTSKHRRDTHHSTPLVNQLHAKAGMTPRGRGRGANGRSPHRQHASPHGYAVGNTPHNTPYHLATAKAKGNPDDTDLLSQPSEPHFKAKEKSSPTNSEWFAVSLSRKLAGFVSGAIGASSKHRDGRIHSSLDEEEDEGDDFVSIDHASGGPSVNSVVAFDNSSFYEPSVSKEDTGVGSQVHADRVDGGARTPPVLSSRPQSKEGAFDAVTTTSHADQQQHENGHKPTHTHSHASNNSHNNSHNNKQTNSHTHKHPDKHSTNTTTNNKNKHPKKEEVKPKKASSPISGAIGSLLSNLSGKSRTHKTDKADRADKAKAQKTPHSPAHHERDAHATSPKHDSAPHDLSAICSTPAEGAVQKFYQLITLRGRNVVIRPAVNIPHDTVVLYY